MLLAAPSSCTRTIRVHDHLRLFRLWLERWVYGAGRRPGEARAVPRRRRSLEPTGDRFLSDVR